MRSNRRTDTKPELALRTALHAKGYRYRKDLRLDLPLRRVRPDIAFTSRKVAVFVDGCFWHACPDHGSKPKNNDWYWSPKLARNVERDHAVNEALAQAGWTVVRLWEHVPLTDAVAAVVTAVGTPKPKLRVLKVPRPPLACAFAPGLMAVSGYFRRVSGIGAPMRSKASRWRLVGSVSTGTAAGVPAKRSSLRVSVPRWASRPGKLR